MVCVVFFAVLMAVVAPAMLVTLLLFSKASKMLVVVFLAEVIAAVAPLIVAAPDAFALDAHGPLGYTTPRRATR